MTKLFFLAFFLTINFFRTGFLHDQEARFPAVRDYGEINKIPEAAEFPCSNIPCKIIVDIKSGSDKPYTTDPALCHLAKLMNLHRLGGVDKENKSVLTVVHAEAAFFIYGQLLQARTIGKEELARRNKLQSLGPNNAHHLSEGYVLTGF